MANDARNTPSSAHLLLVPSGLAIISVLHLLLHARASFRKKRETDVRSADENDAWRARIAAGGGCIGLVLRLLRLAGGLGLGALAMVHAHGTNHTRVEIIAIYLYASLVAVLSLVGSKPWRKLSDIHLGGLYLALLGVFIYRDLYPVAVVGGAAPSRISIIRLAVLFTLGVVIPLSIPGELSTDPVKSASLGSFLTFGYYDSVILYAASHPHLPLEQLPPLESADTMEHLAHEHFKRIDPTMRQKKRYIIISLLAIFKWEYAVMMVFVTLETFATFLSPIGIKQILSYLESTDRAAIAIRPWVWVLWLGVGPVVVSLLSEWYLRYAARMVVQAEAIVTQLVFEHALRIRMKTDEIKEEKKENDHGVKTKDKAGPETSDSASTSASTTAAGSETGSQRSTSPTASTSAETTERDAKGNTDATPADKDEKKAAKQLLGKITNLVTSDLKGLGNARDFPQIFQAGFSAVLSVVFLYQLLGWSALVGTGVIVSTLPIPATVAKLMMNSQREKMKVSDKRVQGVTQMMGVLRMIKLFAWEQKSVDKLTKAREEELSWVRYSRLLNVVNNITNYLLPLCNILVTFGLYTLVMKQDLTASRVFTAISVFSILQGQVSRMTYHLPVILNAKVSLDRIDEFLNETVLIHPTEIDTETTPTLLAAAEDDAVGFGSASFTWDKRNDTEVERDPSKREFTLTIDDPVTFERGAVNLIVGPTGSGKTSLLFALLGEMYYHPLGPQAWFNLPRARGIAYAAQETWVLNDTIRENIVFCTPFDEARYQKVLQQCALEQDLALFTAGDQTEVGEKGLTLSGGQKARITLARAVYSNAEIVLLDDILAALDVHTARSIVENCLKGDLLRDRTVLLVTHNLALTRSVARKLVHVDGNGHVTEETSISKLVEHDPTLRVELAKEEELVEEAAVDVEDADSDIAKKAAGKLTVAEEIQEGQVGIKSLMLYLANTGGTVFWLIMAASVFGEGALYLLQPWWLGQWSNQYETHPASEVNAKKYLAGYSLLVVVELIIGCVGYVTWIHGSVRASSKITKKLVQSIVSATFRWLDTVPVARVITRCTQDIQALDSMLPNLFYAMMTITAALVFRLGAIIVVVGWRALASGLTVVVLALAVGKLYIAAQRSVKREQSVAKSPVLSTFGAGLAGLASIRAYGAQNHFNKQLSQRIDVYSRLSHNSYNINRWVGIRIDALGAVFSAVVAAAVIYGNVLSVGDAGFALSQVLGFAMEVFMFVRLGNMLEVECNSLERIRDFIEIEHEPEAVADRRPPAYWPASGSLRAEKLCARYGPDSPDVLHEVSFDIKSGEHVGVVGRTGAGKSTISLALLRGLLTSGQVFYDGIDINTINLESLRANITLIPQHPDLLAGTLRDNLDPFGEHDDATLNDALRCAGLFTLQKEGDKAVITLDSEVDGGGANFSHGQRQIIALARAQVRKSKLMIMDEATAAIDYETDTIIQESIRTTLGSDVTIITIAHRLQTIMDSDKIIVLDSGRLVEFGTPKDLLAQKEGLFWELVEKSHDKDALYKMVKS